jgi:uncharacterized membrane protein YqjE
VNLFSRILYPTVVVQYYQQNAGFFFAVFAFAAGFMRSVDHIFFIDLFLHSGYLMALLFGGWTLYAVKTIRFTRRLLAAPENRFLYQLVLIPPARQLTALLLTQLMLFLPVTGYSLVMISFGIQYRTLGSVLGIIAYNGLACLAGVWVYRYWLAHPLPEKTVSGLAQRANQWLVKPYFSYAIGYVYSHHTLLLLLSKLASCAVIAGTCILFTTDDYPVKLLSIGVLLGAAINAMIGYQAHYFEHERFSLTKNMPLPLARRFSYLLLAWLVLLLPEWLVLLRYFPPGVQYGWLLKLMGFGLSIAVFCQCRLVRRPVIPEMFIRYVFGLEVMWLVLVLYEVDISAIAIVNAGLAYYWFRRYYYAYEPVEIASDNE